MNPRLVDRVRPPIAHLILLPAVLLSPGLARAQATSWIGSVGNWSTASNWSDGEPAAAIDAEVPLTGTPTVTQTGEACRNLTTGITAAGSTVRIESGGLTVAERIHIASLHSGTILQYGGAVSAAELVMGGPSAAAAYTMSGGSLTLGSAEVGTADAGSAASFAMTAGAPTCTVSGSLRVRAGSTFNCGAGTLNVGTAPTDAMLVDGALLINNRPAAAATGFAMSGTGFLGVTVGPFGVSTVMVSGAATLDGLLFVSDTLAPEGTYEVLRGSPLQGTFDNVTLPANWSWRIEGNSLLVIKGTQPVEPASWGRVKAAFGGGLGSP